MGTLPKIMVFLICIFTAEFAGGRSTTNGEPEVYYTAVCEKRNLQINCFNGKVIDIQIANYGRQDTHTCFKQGQMDDINCRAPNSLEIVAGRCNSRDECAIPVNNKVFGGDPCYGTRKYLEVQYECVQPETSGACQSGPCVNGGTCEETVWGYLCLCPYGFSGFDCESVQPMSTVTAQVPSNITATTKAWAPTANSTTSKSSTSAVFVSTSRSTTAESTTSERVVPTTEKRTTTKRLSTCKSN